MLDVRQVEGACTPGGAVRWVQPHTPGVTRRGFLQLAGSGCVFELDIPDRTTLDFRAGRADAAGPRRNGLRIKVSSRTQGVVQTLYEAPLPAASSVAPGPIALSRAADALVFEVTSEDADRRSGNTVVWSDLRLETRTSQPLTDARWAEPIADSVSRYLAKTRRPRPRPGKRRVLVIGIDGASWALLDDLISEGQLPEIAALKRRGRFGDLRSTIIPESAKAWTSIRTGVGSGKHGVFHFLSRDAARASYWRWLSAADLTSIVIGVPKSRVGERFQGILIGGWNHAARLGYTQPKALKSHLARSHYDPALIQYRNIDYFEAHMSERSDLALALLRGMDWDHAFVVYEYSDTAAHRFGLGSTEWKRAYAFIDTQIGRLLETVDDETTLLLLSDHGWRRYEGSVVLNPWLKEHGFAQWSTHIYSGNRVGLDRATTLEPEREAQEIGALREALVALVDPETGEPLVERVIPAAEAFPGPFAETTHCRVVVQLAQSHHLAGTSQRRLIVSNEPVEHHDMDGFYLLAGPGIAPGKGPAASVYDVAPTVAAHFGVMPPADVDGTALWDFGVTLRAGGAHASPAGQAAAVAEDDLDSAPENEVPTKELRETLRALGYIDE